MLVLYPFFFLVSLILPRKKSLWVFGCYDGYIDNTKYFFEYASTRSYFECYWLANNENELMAVNLAGNKGVLKKSIKGYWLSSRASFTFICTGFSDVNRFFALGSNVINFWHGTPIKKIYLDSLHDLHRFGTSPMAVKIARFLMAFLNSRIKLYYASSDFEKAIVSPAAGISSNKSIVLGTPRYDEIRKMAEKDVFYNLRTKYKKFILYAPTWREGGYWHDDFKLTDEDYKLLTTHLESLCAVLIIKPHPLTKTEELLSFGLKSSERVIYTEELKIKDINALYPHIDILVTDISSSMFDFLIFKKPVLLFMPDLSSYISGDRGIYDYFKESLKDYSFRSWGELASRFNETEQVIPMLHSISEEVGSRVNTCKMIYDDLVSRYYN